MDKEVTHEEHLKVLEMIEELAKSVKTLEETTTARINKFRDVVYSYLEYGSSMGLSSVKANLKNV